MRPAPAVGGAAWLVGTIQFFVLHLVVESRWTTPYGWTTHNISDLGTTDCGPWDPDGRYVCSPWHTGANLGFVLTGVLVMVGVAATWQLWDGVIARVGLALVAAAGVGWVLAGVFPADVDLTMHVIGASLILLIGNVGLIVVGLARGRWAVARRVGLAIGTVGLVAEVLFIDETYLGLGMGGMERVAAFPLLAWTAGVGAALLSGSRGRRTTRRPGRRRGRAT